MKTTNDIRSAYLEFFASRGHQIVPSSSLVPVSDPTLLFTNAGMVQFKDYFLGQGDGSLTRAVSSQRCVRAGGKHNDLENVGYTARHHTFFEMLGNFSFGDYFKREAINFAWEFITEVLKLAPERLWITVYTDDDEAADIWVKEIGVDPDRLTRCGDEDNFWAMGETGPCGPCSEIFYDHGAETPGGPPGSAGQDGDRYVEIWNLVFPQFNRQSDGSLEPLTKPCIDTGMGLERIAAVMQGVHSNYDIDIFQHLLGAVAEIAGGNDLERTSMQVIADHIRSCAFLIGDGVLPSNEGRGYVLRRIIRRAARHGHKLGLTEPFFFRLVEALEKVMGGFYPELSTNRSAIEAALKREEERFAETLSQGLRILDETVAGLGGKHIPGEQIFLLYDTYGFPVDLTADIARERGLTMDLDGFEAQMQKQRERARAASRFGNNDDNPQMATDTLAEFKQAFSFVGYESLEQRACVLGIYQAGEPVERAAEGASITLVLDKTPFYAESGGQVGDRGNIEGGGARVEVSDTQKQAGVHVHFGKVTSGELAVGDSVLAGVSPEWREPIRINHSATHLMHAALRQVLGDHVTQKGSLVAPDRLRFDFAHPAPLTAAELAEVEGIVNREIRRNADANVAVMDYEEAVASGALALFGEKYEERVRVFNMGDFSVELCGGTHVQRSGDIGLFKFIAETGVAAGVRRVEAVTGEVALATVVETDHALERITQMVKGTPASVEDKVAQLVERTRQLEKQVKTLESRLATQTGVSLADTAVEVGGIKVLATIVETGDPGALRNVADEMKDKLGTAAVILGAIDAGKVRLVAAVSKNATDRINAGKLVNFVASQVGGKGGGRADMAQAGGNEPDKLPDALAGVAEWVGTQLGL